MKRVLLADNHPLFRAGTRQILEASGEFTVVAEVGDTEGCIEAVAHHQPDVLMLDLNMPESGGFSVVRHLRSLDDQRVIVILSMHSDEAFVDMARELGCNGFVAKEDAGHELINVLNSLDQGFQATSSTGESEDAGLTSMSFDKHEQPHGLTAAELRVLVRVAEAATSSEIAVELDVSARTIETHRQNIIRKLSLFGPNALVRFAFENKLQIISWAKDGRKK